MRAYLSEDVFFSSEIVGRIGGRGCFKSERGLFSEDVFSESLRFFTKLEFNCKTFLSCSSTVRSQLFFCRSCPVKDFVSCNKFRAAGEFSRGL